MPAQAAKSVEIRDAQVDWRKDVANPPTLEVLLDRIPDRSELRFEHDNDIWLGTLNGYAEFFAWSGDGNDGGYSGRHFEITTVDGDDVTLKGPWASRAGCVNKRGLGPVVDVRLATDPCVLENGHTFKSGALTLEAARTALEHVADDCTLERTIRFDNEEPYWIPTRTDS